MLKDFKFLRRNSGKHPAIEELENVPVNSNYSSAVPIGGDASRAPLNSIQDSCQNPKLNQEQASANQNKVKTTPPKTDRRIKDASFPARTPERSAAGVSARHRFGWFQQNVPSSNVVAQNEDGKIGAENNLTQSSRGVGFSNGTVAKSTPRSTQTFGKTCSNYSEGISVQSTPNKSVSKPPNPGFLLLSNSRLPANGGASGGNFAVLSKGTSFSSGPSITVGTNEVPQFDLKEDPSFWMDHNVQVMIRVRPLNRLEENMHGYSRCLKQESSQTITWIGPPETRFTFDHVASESVDQESLFQMVGQPMVENCLLGYNSCMFAYGQTGSGKTYSMLGEIQGIEGKPSRNRGLTPRIFEFLFARIRAEEEKHKNEGLMYNCRCSFLEIYNEQITDLLDPLSTNLLLREDTKKGVYVENLSEFEVDTVSDILSLLAQGSSNRKVAATNMNGESSRSHSVFTCVIESRWEKDSTANLRFAQLNLVDLAGSERQKSSGAEGERLREAANINKSLSTLGHVIMALVDVANGKVKHVPYRDSRLTFLLQDSLGGNSKTMIIANVSPSICCAAETLNTLKFAQRAKLIQNNAVVNEDTSGDVTALQHQLLLLKEELSVLKREKIPRYLSFESAAATCTTEMHENAFLENEPEIDQKSDDVKMVSGSKCMMRISSKQIKAFETILAGSLRREQMAEASIKQLEAEMEQLNRLLRQREEDTQRSKMMLKFREDKIRRIGSLIDGLMPVDTYLSEENRALRDEIHLLKAKIDRNPEITRFAKENIKILDQLRRFQEFYEEGEREILLTEVSQLRAQMLQNIEGKCKKCSSTSSNITDQVALDITKERDSAQSELKITVEELEDCRRKLQSCVEENARLCRELDSFHGLLNNPHCGQRDPDNSVELVEELSSELPSERCILSSVQEKKDEENRETLINHNEEVVHLQLELDILKIILKEERSAHSDIEDKEKLKGMKASLDDVKRPSTWCQNDQVFHAFNEEEMDEVSKQVEAETAETTRTIWYQNDRVFHAFNEEEMDVEAEAAEEKLKGMKASLDDAKRPNTLYQNDQVFHAFNEEEMDEVRKQAEAETVEEKLKGMQESLDDAKRLNTWYQNDRVYHAFNEEEMDEVRKQAEAETAEVIVCLQEELATLQQQIQGSNLKVLQSENCIMCLETELKELHDKLYLASEDNQILGTQLEEKNWELKTLSEQWEQLSGDICEVLVDGHEALKDASGQLDVLSSSFPQKRTWISEQFTQMMRIISEKELLIGELNQCLDDIYSRRNDMDSMLASLKGATTAITEAQQHECSEKDREIFLLSSEMNVKASNIAELKKRLRMEVDQTAKASHCATAAFVIVNRLSELNEKHLKAIKDKDIQLKEITEMNHRKDDLLHEQSQMIEEAKKQAENLNMQLETLEATCAEQRVGHFKEQRLAYDMEQKLEFTKENGILQTKNEYRCHGCACGAKNHEVREANVPPFENAVGLKMVSLDDRLHSVEQVVHEVGRDLCQLKEVGDAKVLASQKAAEDSSIFRKFEECQESINDADVMNKKLLIANETLKHEIEMLKKMELMVADERDSLISDVQCLQSANSLKDQQCKKLEEQLVMSFMDIENLVLLLEDLSAQVQVDFGNNLPSICCMKSQLVDTMKSLRSWLEDVWSELIVKDCAVSVLHLCHMGILLETVIGSNAENGFLHYGLCESNSIIVDLREQNFKSRRELEMCSVIKGKLLADIKNSFDHISQKEDETGELGIKLTTFDKKIADLQLQEDLMLQRANYIGSQLVHLIKELDLSGAECGRDSLKIDFFCKDLESLIFSSELEVTTLQNAEQERVLEHLKKELIFLNIDTGLKEQLLVDKEVEDAFLQTDRLFLLSNLQESSLKIKQLEEENKVLENDIQTDKLHEVTTLKTENWILRQDSGEAKAKVESSLCQIKALDTDKQNLQAKVSSLEMCVPNLQSNLNMRNAALNELQDLQSVILGDLCLMGVDLALHIACSNEILESEFNDTIEAKAQLLTGVLDLESKHEKLVKELTMKEKELNAQIEKLRNGIYLLDASCCKLQDDLLMKDAELRKMSFLEAEYGFLLQDLEKEKAEAESYLGQITALDMDKQNLKDKISSLEKCVASLQNDLDASCCKLQDDLLMRDAELRKMSSLEAENGILLLDLEKKTAEAESYLCQITALDMDKQNMKDKISSLEKCVDCLQNDLDLRHEELTLLQGCQSVTGEELCLASLDLAIHLNEENALKDENAILERNLNSSLNFKHEVFSLLNLGFMRCVDAVNAVDMMSSRMLGVINDENCTILEKMFEESLENIQRASDFLEELRCIKGFVDIVVSENSLFQSELSRKDDVLRGLSFDLRLLQESASIAKDQKDDIEYMTACLEAVEDELAVKSSELDEAVAHGHLLEEQLHEQTDTLNSLSCENFDLRAQIKNAYREKCSILEELTEKMKRNDTPEMVYALESLNRNLASVIGERDRLQETMLILKEELTEAKVCAEETEAAVVEAQQMAEARRIYGEEKDKEVKLLETSVEELECTVNALENKVDMVKGEVEKHKLQREDLELELHAVKVQLKNVESGDTDIKRLLYEKENKVQEAQEHVQTLEREIASRDVEISQCKAHISELQLHAEAQSHECKEKLKALEAMAGASMNVTNSSSNKMERSSSRPRGSGSPFKCIGLGSAHQLKSEIDEELTAAKLRIEELEGIAATRQKEIFALNTKLAAAESMTHDVIRDLLGVKLDMINYVSLLDNQPLSKLTAKAVIHSLEAQAPEGEVNKLKNQFNDFIVERQGLLEEINRKQAEVVDLQVSVEKLHRKDQLLTAENELIKTENAWHKKRVMELESTVTKLSGQQNLQQRIHHHAKIKEENTSLKVQNEDLRVKLQRSEVIISHVKEEEWRLNVRLRETEAERLQLAQKLLALCTSILEAGGQKILAHDVSLPEAEEALEKLKSRVISLEEELGGLKYGTGGKRIQLKDASKKLSARVRNR